MRDPYAALRAGARAGPWRQAHRLLVRGAHLGGLTGEEGKARARRQARRALARRLLLHARRAIDEVLAPDDRQAHAAVLLGIADQRLRRATPGHALRLLQEAPAHEDHAAVAVAEMLERAVGGGSLPDPRHEVLVHDVAGDPAAGHRVLDRRGPVRDPLLHVRLLFVRHAVEEPADAERVAIVDGHAPLEVPAGEQAVRPEAAAADRPQLVLLGLALEDPAIGEAVLELLEADLE